MSDKIVNVNITFKNTEPTEALKEYATEKIQTSLKKFVHHDTNVVVVLSVEKLQQKADASFRADGADFHASADKDDMYAAIDEMCAALAHQLRKHKEKITAKNV